MLNKAQKKKAIKVWENYLQFGKNPDRKQRDKEREKIIPTINACISKYLQHQIAIDAFKSEIDSFSKKYPFWGFRGMNGQMFFNMLFNSSSRHQKIKEFENILHQVLPMPKNIKEAKSKIDLIANFSASFSNLVSNKRQAPRVKSCIPFVSYFWQIQDHTLWPVYYRSMIETLQDIDLWHPSGDFSKDYGDFFNLNVDLKKFYESHSNLTLNLWDVEHAFWDWAYKNEDSSEISLKKSEGEILKLPTSYIPPVVSIIPKLAKNDFEIVKLCKNSGISVEKAFEDKISIIFKMLGYKVESLGQGYGRVPDGIAICSEFYYAVIFDAKVRKDGYSLGTDDRAFREYIFSEIERLKRQGMRNIYFIVISSFFTGNFDNAIRSIKIETDIQEVIFLEASGLITLLEEKLKNNDLNLGPKGVQSILTQSGVITDSDIKKFLKK